MAIANRLNLHGAAATITAFTIIYSLSVSYLVNESVFTTVKIAELIHYGGTSFEKIADFELWRMATAQLVHAKMPHMVFNAVCLLLLGGFLERKLGALRTLLIWLIAGGTATILSPIWIAAPWNIGTGASQAVFAFAGCIGVFAWLDRVDRRLSLVLIAIAIIPGLLLDFIFAGYPKPGHVFGLLFGASFGLLYQHGLNQQTSTK